MAAAAECASEAVPCEQCGSGALPCPLLGAFEHLRVGASHPGLSGAGDAARAPESEPKHTYVWRSLCRRASWHYAGAATLSAAGGGPDQAARAEQRVGQAQSATPRSGLGEQLQDGGGQEQAEGERALPHIAPERLAMHRKAHSCWLAADGKVFDATLFLSRHPAGSEVILKYAGSDCSEDLSLHSNGAQKLWQKYCIGMLAHGKFLSGRGGRRLACANKVVPCQQCSSAEEPCPELAGEGEGGTGSRRRSLDDFARRRSADRTSGS